MSRRLSSVAALLVAAIIATGAAAGTGRGQLAPVNSAPPTIGGTPQVGATLTASIGRWSGVNVKYAYQWMRCDSAGGGCASLGGATGATYVVPSALAGATARVVVTASNKNGSGVATSAATAVITAPTTAPPVPPPPPPPPPPPSPPPTAPSLTSPPSVTGTAQQGQTLTGSPGTWGGATPIDYTYQWQRCDKSGGACGAVLGAVANTFVLGSADVGATIRVSVTATSSVGSATATSAATALVIGLGCAEPASTTDRLYSCASAFNTPIPASPPIHPDTSAMIGWDTWVKNYDSNTLARPWFGLWKEYESVVSAPASTALVTVQINNRGTGKCAWMTVQAPIPAGTQVQLSGAENSLSVLAADGREYEFYDLTPPGTANTVLSGNSLSCPANSLWQASSFAVPTWGSGTSGWVGSGYGKDSIRASDVSTASGLVRLRDVQNAPSDWGHALAFTYHKTCGSAAPHPFFVPPASASDGSYNGAGCLPMGARVQLDPSIDCAAQAWVVKHGQWAAAYCRTLQKYGAIVVDSNGASVFNQVFNTDWNAYPWASQYNMGCFTAGCDQSSSIALPNDLMQRFRVIDWTKWTGA